MDVHSVALTVIAVLAVVVVLRYAQPVLIPIVIGVLISYVLAPVVESLARRGISRWIGAGMVLLVLCACLGFSAYKLAPQAMDIVEDVPVAARRLVNRFKATRRSPEAAALERVQRAATEIDKAAAAATQPVPTPSGVQRVQVVQPAFSATDYL